MPPKKACATDDGRLPGAVLREWLTTVTESPGRTPPHVAAIGGPPRAGCTTLVRDAIRELHLEPVWIATGAVAGVHLESAAASAVAVSGRRKVIVIDELDAIAASDPVTTSAVGHVLKKGMVPVVLIAHGFPDEWRTKSGDLVPRDATLIRVPRRDLAYQPPPPTKGLVGAEAVLRGGSGVVPTMFRGDGIAAGAVFDNFWKHATSLEAARDIAETFSAHDAIQDTMARMGSHDDPYATLPLAVAATRCAAKDSKVTITTFGSAWSKTNAVYAKRASVRNVLRTRVENGFRASLSPPEGLDTLRGAIKTCVARGDLEGAAVVATTAGLDPPTLLAVMRLWSNCGYTLPTHAKIKKAMLASDCPK